MSTETKYRPLRDDERDKPLPPGAQCNAVVDPGEWVDSMRIGLTPDPARTYRVPVTEDEPSQPQGGDVGDGWREMVAVPDDEFAQLKADAEKWREHCKNPQPQIPGMPVGWEVDPEKIVVRRTEPPERTGSGWRPELWIPVRRIQPPQPKLIGDCSSIADGWLAEDKCGDLSWFSHEPMAAEITWEYQKPDFYGQAYDAIGKSHRNPPKFRDNLPWDQRYVQIKDGKEVIS